MSDETTPEVRPEETGATTDRRSLFTKGAALAAVVTVAGLSSSRTALAADGDIMNVSGDEVGIPTKTTSLRGGTTFRVTDGESAGSASLYGVQSGDSAGAYGVRGEHNGSQGVGVYGKTIGSSGVGVYGQHLGDTRGGTGVFGVSDNGPGVTGSGTSYDLLANGNGRVGLAAAGNSGSPTASGTIGTIARDSAGNLWYCYAANKWQRLGGPAAGGAFHPIAPVRVFDSRKAGFPGNGVFTGGSFRVISVKDGRNQSTGAVTVANAVPAGATAVAFNVTVAEASAKSHLKVVPGDVVSTDVSTLNWSAGNNVANSAISKLDANRQLRIIAGPSVTFHAIIDISGYYL